MLPPSPPTPPEFWPTKPTNPSNIPRVALRMGDTSLLRRLATTTNKNRESELKMRTFGAAAVAVMAGFLVSCAPVPVRVAAAFNEADAKAMLPGGSSVTGSAFIRQQGGGVVSCAGGVVLLIPKTAYAGEWARHVYGADSGPGYRPAMLRGINFLDSDAFSRTVRTTNCDVSGRFNFDRVGDGCFYVVSKVTWTVGYETQGGSIMRSIELSGGEKKDIVLSPKSRS
jgi:hypothetical protein